MTFKHRINLEGHTVRIYENGGIFLYEPGESLYEVTKGEISEGSSEAESIKKCLLCDQPSLHWGLFMTGQESAAYLEKQEGYTTGTFFGLCEKHDPHKSEDEVCDAVYKLMENLFSVKRDLEMAETVMRTWHEELMKDGHSSRESLEKILSLLREDRLTVEYEFSDEMKHAMEIALLDQLKKELN